MVGVNFKMKNKEALQASAPADSFTLEEERELSKKSEDFLVSLKNQNAQKFLNRIIRDSNYDENNIYKMTQELLSKNSQFEDSSLAKMSDAEVQIYFLLSITQDLISWGAKIKIFESQFYIKKSSQFIPNFQQNALLRSAMTNLKRSETEYEMPVDFSEAKKFVRSGIFELVRVDPKNEKDSRVFRTGVTTWSMPYRGREGRSSRYVLKVIKDGITIPCGIIEIGDDAPHSPLRDQAIGFRLPPQDSPLNPYLKDRLNALRLCMRSEDLPVNPKMELSELNLRWQELNLDNFSALDPKLRKRMNYLNRIYKGELALSDQALWNSADISAAIRAIKDVTLNRVHTEVVICGALPPFGPLLVGKLTAMMMNHPQIRESLNRDIGTLLQDTFEFKKLENWLPRFGPLLVTTKGLFPQHSSQYNRVRIPSHSGYIPLKKLGNTVGQTMSNISDLSMKYATEINSRLGGQGISRDYGSGGSKRQRILQRAAQTIGLDPAMLYADISKPVYGHSLVANPQEVVLGGFSPKWVDSSGNFQSDSEYEAAAQSLWRKQWSSTIVKRLNLADNSVESDSNE